MKMRFSMICAKYEWGYGFNEHNILAGKDDAKFAVGNQWDPVVEQRRKDLRKPVLTFNRLIAFIAQILGNRLMNETEIRVYPDKATHQGNRRDPRSDPLDFQNSHADFARDEASKYQVVGGEGAYTLSIDYTSDDVFEQEIKLAAITDPYSAVFDPLGIEPSGRDCQWAFVGDDIPQQNSRNAGLGRRKSHSSMKRWNQSGFWISQDTVRIVSYWRMVTEGTKVLALYQDGTVHDVTDMEEFEYINFVEQRSDGSPYIRKVPKRFARLYVCSGNAILKGHTIIRFPPCRSIACRDGELNDGEKIHRWGLIRFLKDPQRLHNYWRSTVAEQLVAAPATNG